MHQMGTPAVARSAVWPQVQVGVGPASGIRKYAGLLTSAALTVYILQSFARLGDVFPVIQPLRLGLLTQAALVLVLLTKQARAMLRSAISHPTSASVAVLAALAVVTVPTGAWPTGSLNHLTGVYYNSLLLFAAGILAFGSSRTRTAVVCTVVVLAAYTAAQPLLSGKIGRFGIGFTYDQNVTGAYLVMLVPWAAAWAAVERDARWKLLPLLALPLLVYGIARTGSRGGVLGLFAMIPFLYAVAPPRRRGMLVAIAAVVTIMFVSYGKKPLRNFRKLTNKTDYNYVHLDGRVEVWKRGMSYVRERPITGYGINGFRWRELDWKLDTMGGGKDTAAHNMYLEVAVDLGLIGLAAFLTACIGALVRLAGLRYRAMVRFRATGDPADAEFAAFAGAAAASLLSVMVTGFFLSIAHQAPMYFVWAAAVGMTVAEQRRLAQPRPGAPAGTAPSGRSGAQTNGGGWRSRHSAQRWQLKHGRSHPTR